MELVLKTIGCWFSEGTEMFTIGKRDSSFHICVPKDRKAEAIRLAYEQLIGEIHQEYIEMIEEVDNEPHR